MPAKFNYFVILAEMRTGSNFLEENLNRFSGLQSHGELFNPHFLGSPNKSEKFGISMQDRAVDPTQLIDKIRDFGDRLHGFRYFHDHDPRVLDACLNDPGCAKIILTRNPVESYVSREIVRQTKQWRLGDLKNAKTAKIKFDPEGFATHLNQHRQFQKRILTALQVTGQAGFYLAYEDISDVDVVNGLVRFLGVDETRDKPATRTKKQNPQPLHEKVSNFAQMEAALAATDYFDLNALPNFEPRRGACVPGYFAARKSPVLFAPIASGPTREITGWLAKLDGVGEEDLLVGFNQKTLRQWKRKSGQHRTFTVVRHPVPRLHNAFVRHILMPGDQNLAAIRQVLIKSYDLPIPSDWPDKSYDRGAHRAAFVSFARFIKGNLNGQTSVRIDPAWASQSEILRGFARFMPPDFIFREDELAAGLASLANLFGRKSPDLIPSPEPSPFGLDAIYCDEVETAVRSAYQRDYMMFGFGPWKP